MIPILKDNDELVLTGKQLRIWKKKIIKEVCEIIRKSEWIHPKVRNKVIGEINER